MGHSFTTFKDKSILCKDYKLEAWLFLICREIDTMKNKPAWLKEARDFWYEQAELSINGCIDPDLDEFLDNHEKVRQFTKIIENIYKKLEQFDKEIPANFLNKLHEISPEAAYSFKQDDETEAYLRYGRALLKLLKGQLGDELEMA